jgi:hypothetical protein
MGFVRFSKQDKTLRRFQFDSRHPRGIIAVRLGGLNLSVRWRQSPPGCMHRKIPKQAGGDSQRVAAGLHFWLPPVRHGHQCVMLVLDAREDELTRLARMVFPVDDFQHPGLDHPQHRP